MLNNIFKGFRDIGICLIAFVSTYALAVIFLDFPFIFATGIYNVFGSIAFWSALVGSALLFVYVFFSMFIHLD